MIRSTVYWVTAEAPGRLGILARPRAGDWLEDEMKALREAAVDVLVSLLTGEEEAELQLQAECGFCRAAGMTFIYFPIDDRGTPKSDVDAVALICRLKHFLLNGKAVGVHCRMGIGRSSMIAAAVLVMLGVDGVEAFERLAASRGLTVPDTDAQRTWALTLRPSHQTTH